MAIEDFPTPESPSKTTLASPVTAFLGPSTLSPAGYSLGFDDPQPIFSLKYEIGKVYS